MADEDLTSLDELKPDGQVDQILVLDESEHETRSKLKAWANIEHVLEDGGHTISVSATEPTPLKNWQLWFNPDTGELLIYQGNLDRWVTAEQPTFNYLHNAGFSRFPNATSIPIGWASYGISTTGTARPAGAGLADTRQKFGPYALVINSGDGELHAFQLIGKTGSTFAPIDYWRGRTVSFGCWVFAPAANKVRLILEAFGVEDGLGNAIFFGSPYHPGDSTWRWLTVTMKTPDEVTLQWIAATCRVEGPGIIAVFSGPTFVEGSWCPHVLPSSILLRSELMHLGSSNGALDTVASGDMFYGPQGGNLSLPLAIGLAPFNCFISNLRVFISGGAGVGQTYVATLLINGFPTLTCTIAGAATFNFDNVNKIQVSAGAQLSLKVNGTSGVVVGTVRASILIEEFPFATT